VSLVRSERRGGVDVLTLDSPENRNALSLRVMEELLAGIRGSDGRALVLDHDGTVFCAGVDLRERQAPGADQSRHSTLLGELLRALWDHPRPVLCRVGGAVRGGGMGLVACSDVVVAEPAASFAFSEVRVGVAPAIVGGIALRKVPLGPLLPALVSGEVFDAEEARRLGLVTAVAEDAAGEVDRRCAGIVAGAPGAVATTKALARRLSGAESLDPMLAELEALSAELFSSDEAREGMAAFAERRPPSWAG
jgi:enoyl-CoA hydratase/carnithine racemase